MSDSPAQSLGVNRSIAEAEAIHIKRQILTLQELYPSQGYIVKDVAESTTILSSPIFGRKLNHTYGFALSGPVTNDDLHIIEDAYKLNGVQPELDMCEFADSTAFDLLSTHYKITGSLCEYQRSLADFQCSDILGRPIDVSILGPSNYNTFLQASVEGFRDGGRSAELLKVLAESAAARPDTILFSASINGEVVGTAGMAMIDTKERRIAILYIDSCLPSARGKGVHKALLLERLRVAKDRGCDLVAATAREGSISARNIEKIGLKKAYACKIYTKDQ
ncbi:hypothetical protein E4T43_04636 [Aureobasidium subglaciale]|nr:hypothetical protein E4T43_04636 [Aureobasidium subglaciale]